MGTRFAQISGTLVRLVALACFVVVAADASAQTSALQASFGGQSYAFFESEDGGGAVITTHATGQRVLLPQPVGVVYSHLAATHGGWLVAGSERDEDGLRSQFLVAPTADGEGVRIIRGPGKQEGRLRQGTVILVDDGRLAGLAWLEGDGRRQLTVKASEWTGRRWRNPRTVSAVGPGSQLALAGSVLADGSWLLTWSAFDGEDDEILWSQRIGQGWTSPRRLLGDNAVPDITPTLASCGTGALAAWSRYEDGHYRLRIARFDGNGWVEERSAGGPGTIFPVFLPSPAAEARLLFRDALTQGWSALDLDAEGLAVRRVDIVATSPQRPLLEPEASGLVRFDWVGKDESQGGISRQAAWKAIPPESDP